MSELKGVPISMNASAQDWFRLALAILSATEALAILSETEDEGPHNIPRNLLIAFNTNLTEALAEVSPDAAAAIELAKEAEL